MWILFRKSWTLQKYRDKDLKRFGHKNLSKDFCQSHVNISLNIWWASFDISLPFLSKSSLYEYQSKEPNPVSEVICMCFPLFEAFRYGKCFKVHSFRRVLLISGCSSPNCTNLFLYRSTRFCCLNSLSGFSSCVSSMLKLNRQMLHLHTEFVMLMLSD